MTRRAFASLIAAALAVGLALRLAEPDLRPMHHDEANQAVRFGQLLETGHYRYDPDDHHGPTLYYATLPFAWVRGQGTLAELDERTLRLVPAVFSGATLLLCLLLVGGFGRTAIAASVWLAALSPALTYYGRFYIQESLFTCFSLAGVIALGRYVRRPSPAAAVWAGACAGLAYATKETAVVVLAAAAIAAIVAARTTPRQADAGQEAPRPAFPRHAIGAFLLWAGGAALFVAVVLYTSFFAHPSGFLESIQAYGGYIRRGVSYGPHVQPWYSYLQVLGYSASGGLVWTEALVLVLAAIGLAGAVRGANGGFWPRYIGLYAVIAAAIFSAVRYKTPWNLLPFHVGLILMAGNGVAVAIAGLRTGTLRRVAIAGLVLGCAHLGLQSWRASFRYPADERNPYAYVHTVPDFLRLARRIEDLAAVHPDRQAMLVKVIAGPYEQWPLPWYLRRLTRVGYWDGAEHAGWLAGVPVIVAAQDHAATVEAALGDRYVSEYYGLRPNVLLSVHIEPSLWAQYLATR